MPLFSIIIPIYNVADCLHRCVDSIVCQTCDDFELLLIDDGSTDGSGAICDGYAVRDARIRVFHKENGGVSSARNLGLDEAKGKYVVFVDGDDIVSTNFLAKINNHLRDDVDMVHYGWNYVDGENTSHYEVCSVDACLEIKDVCKRNIYHGFVWSYVFKKEIIESHGMRFLSELKYAEDWNFILNYYIYVRRMVVLSECLYTQIKREGSATNRCLGEKYVRDNFAMYRNVETMSKDVPMYMKRFFERKLKAINIWLANNVVYESPELREIYRTLYERLCNEYCKFRLSIVLRGPTCMSKQSYRLISKIFNKFGECRVVHNLM